ncbi:MAG TPA: Holliday junction branch migration protein RuvA [Segeticoccus sp.]|uniref:Holliday junction branch migration protein RuvA n=1 Tax=Segeticoccus sp. TaxID=2706531 RepID=UPI002D7F45F3|nr:Holliday junction branch migration protein RuvA [Segeticoccus sp.]HET8599646.1 Holliday junction branch migration protein RuvA [Segeticoccus sp.]
MISSVRGPVLDVGLDSAVVEVGGVGLLVHTTPTTAAGLRAGGEVRLATSLVVREESLTLYGFADADERAVFEQVQTVSGVGPRLALAMLAVHPPEDLRRAVSEGDLVALTKVPGIGKKGAERIVLELRDKIGAPAVGGPAGASRPVPAADAWKGQVKEALTGLGWSAKQAEDAIEVVGAGEGVDTGDISGLLRAALRELGR